MKKWALLVPLGIALSGCRGPGSRAGTSRPRLIVLFLIDTLRADRVSLYGYARPTTPEIDRAFRSALIADRCFANANWTLPSHVSLFTSTAVNRHGVRFRDGVLPRNFPVLAESLAAGGYATLAVTNGGFVDPRYGFARGFDTYTHSEEPVEKEVDRALALIDEASASRVFLFFHTYQVHNYAPSEESARELFGSTRPLGEGWQRRMMEQLRILDAADADRVTIDRYDAAVRRTDDAFARFEAGLRRRGRWDETAILLTSDHGEELFDHRSPRGSPPLWGHGQPSLYDGELRVPLLVRAPGRHWTGHLDRPVSLLDVAPTILDLAGIAPPSTFEGRSIVSVAADRVIVAEAPPHDAVAVRRGDHKVIVRAGYRQRATDGRLLPEFPARECLALETDPLERRGDRCDAPWAAGLVAAEERYVVDGFPGSLVLRLTRPDPGPCEVVATGSGRAPGARLFAASPADSVEIGDGAVRARLTSGPAPAWIALRPEDADRALAVDLSGCGALADSAGSPVADGSLRAWSGYLWRGASSLPSGNVAISIPPMLEPLASGRVADTPGWLAVLRNLGYLTGGETEKARPLAATSPPVPREPADLVPERVRIRIR